MFIQAYTMAELLVNFNCPILNVEKRRGHTDYIDFINQKEVEDNMLMKGVDCTGRCFITVKADIILLNGSIIHTFSTFFQRYSNVNDLWHCCGHDGRVLMHSEGGMTIPQFKFLHDLIVNKEMDLTLDLCKEIRLNYYFTKDVEDKDYGNYPVKIRLRI